MTQPAIPAATPAQRDSPPQVIVASRLPAAQVQTVLTAGGVLDLLTTHDYGLAVALATPDDDAAALLRLLAAHHIYTVVWLLPPPDGAPWFHLQNGDIAQQQYAALHGWVQQHGLVVHAVAFEMAPPPAAQSAVRRGGWFALLPPVWHARHAAPFAQAVHTYSTLLTQMHRAGYRTHLFQMPLVADERRAGTTLLQRALSISDLPADEEVLIVARAAFAGLFGSGTIMSYGPSADSIALGDPQHPTAPTAARLTDDLLLAATLSDTVYLFDLETLHAAGLLPTLHALDWSQSPPPLDVRHAATEGSRLGVLLLLWLAQHWRAVLAIAGWLGVAAVLLHLWRQPTVLPTPHPTAPPKEPPRAT